MPSSHAVLAIVLGSSAGTIVESSVGCTGWEETARGAMGSAESAERMPAPYRAC